MCYAKKCKIKSKWKDTKSNTVANWNSVITHTLSLHTTYFPVQLAAGGVLQPPLVCSDQQYEAGLNECAQSAPHRSCLQTVHGGLCLLYHNVFAATIPKKHGPSPISTAWATCGHVKWADKYPINRRTESCWLQPPGLNAAASRVSERERGGHRSLHRVTSSSHCWSCWIPLQQTHTPLSVLPSGKKNCASLSKSCLQKLKQQVHAVPAPEAKHQNKTRDYVLTSVFLMSGLVSVSVVHEATLAR